MPLFEQLRESALFATLSEVELALVGRAARKRLVPANEDVVVVGGEPEFLYAVLSGSIRIFHRSPDGVEFVAKVFRAPAIFGELEAVTQRRYAENVATQELSEILAIPTELVRHLLDQNARFSRALLHHVCSCFIIASHTEAATLTTTVRGRLAHYLLNNITCDGRPTEAGIRPRLPLTQDDMARAVGATRRAVAKEILRWQSAGVIKRVRDHYVICDARALADEADGDRPSIFISGILADVG